MNPLGKVRLGRTDLQVTRLGLGGAVLGGLYKEVEEQTAADLVRHVVEAGLTLLDTAPLYGHGKSEIRMGRALKGVDRESFLLSTKVGRLLVPQESPRMEESLFENLPPLDPVFDFSYDAVMRSVDESLERLQLDRIDILHIHDPDDFYDQALKKAYPALDKLRREGVIGAVGAGMNQAEMLAQFAREADFDCFLLAGRYTLIDHSGLQELLPLCEQKQISIIIGGPFNSGILASGAKPGAKFNYADAPSRIVDCVRGVEEICNKHGVPLKAAALQFPLAHPTVASVIPGARSVEEFDENLRMARRRIPADFWADLRASKLVPEDAPAPSEEE